MRGGNEGDGGGREGSSLQDKAGGEGGGGLALTTPLLAPAPVEPPGSLLRSVPPVNIN